MSNKVSMKANLSKAHRLQTSGVKSLLDAQPDMKQAFIKLWRDGKNVAQCRRALVMKFPNGDVPSQRSLGSYVKNHLQAVVVVEPYAPDYFNLLRQYDSVKKLIAYAITAEQRYQFAVKSNVSLTTQARLFTLMLAAADKVNAMEVRMGLSRSVHADGTNAWNASTKNAGVGAATDTPEDFQKSVADGAALIESYETFRTRVGEQKGEGINVKPERD